MITYILYIDLCQVSYNVFMCCILCSQPKNNPGILFYDLEFEVPCHYKFKMVSRPCYFVLYTMSIQVVENK